MTLTHEEIRHFRHSGYWALPVRLPEQVAADLKTALCADIAAEIEPAVLDATGRTVRLSKLLERAPIFYQTATWPPLLDALESLLGPHIELVKNRHNHATLNLATAHISGWWQRWLESFHHAVLYQMRGSNWMKTTALRCIKRVRTPSAAMFCALLPKAISAKAEVWHWPTYTTFPTMAS